MFRDFSSAIIASLHTPDLHVSCLFLDDILCSFKFLHCVLYSNLIVNHLYFRDWELKTWQGLVIKSANSETNFIRCFWLTNPQRVLAIIVSLNSKFPIHSHPCYFQRTSASVAFWNVGNWSQRSSTRPTWLQIHLGPQHINCSAPVDASQFCTFYLARGPLRPFTEPFMKKGAFPIAFLVIFQVLNIVLITKLFLTIPFGAVLEVQLIVISNRFYEHINNEWWPVLMSFHSSPKTKCKLLNCIHNHKVKHLASSVSRC